MYRPLFHPVTIALAALILTSGLQGDGAHQFSSATPQGQLLNSKNSWIRSEESFRRDSSPSSKIDFAFQCHDFLDLTREQANLCRHYPHETAIAFRGLRKAVAECQYQFRWERWNCSSFNSIKIRIPRSTPFFNKGYRESAFAYAVFSAGVTHAVARACSQGLLRHCGCQGYDKKVLKFLTRDLELQASTVHHVQHGFYRSEYFEMYVGNEDEFEGRYVHQESIERLRGIRRRRNTHQPATIEEKWHWGGCQPSLEFGVLFARLFLDLPELKNDDLKARINLHNNHAGRLAVIDHLEQRCRCFGVTGSCTTKICWRVLPDFRKVGNTLKAWFKNASQVDHGSLDNKNHHGDAWENLEENEDENTLHPNRPLARISPAPNRRERRLIERDTQKLSRRYRAPDKSLLYFQNSPNFCTNSTDSPGTTGRRCNKNSSDADGCAMLCCERGYNELHQKRVEKCKCKFQWCCKVECEDCTLEEVITVCK